MKKHNINVEIWFLGVNMMWHFIGQSIEKGSYNQQMQ